VPPKYISLFLVDIKYVNINSKSEFTLKEGPKVVIENFTVEGKFYKD